MQTIHVTPEDLPQEVKDKVSTAIKNGDALLVHESQLALVNSLIPLKLKKTIPINIQPN